MGCEGEQPGLAGTIWSGMPRCHGKLLCPNETPPQRSWNRRIWCGAVRPDGTRGLAVGREQSAVVAAGDLGHDKAEFIARHGCHGHTLSERPGAGRRLRCRAWRTRSGSSSIGMRADCCGPSSPTVISSVPASLLVVDSAGGGLMAASPVGPVQTVGQVAAGLDDQQVEQASYLVDGQSDQLGGLGVGTVVGVGGPAGAGDTHEGGQRDAGRGVASVESQLTVADAAADEQPVKPGRLIRRWNHRHPGPVVVAASFRAVASAAAVPRLLAQAAAMSSLRAVPCAPPTLTRWLFATAKT